MKKLFVAALSTLLVLGMAACGSKKANSSSSQQGAKTADDYSDAAIADGDTVYGMTGPATAYIGGEKIGEARAWGAATPEFGKATATSLRDVAKRDLDVAAAFESKDLKGLYKVEQVELGHQAVAGYMKGAYDEKGNYVERDGVFTVKFVKYGIDEETQNPFIDTWLPSPEAYSESLTPATWWAPLHQEAKDEHGLAHDSDCVNLAGAGRYTYYIGVYKKAVAGSYYGLAVFQDEKLSDYDPDAVTYEGVNITVTGVPTEYQTGHDLYIYFWGSSQIDSMFLPATLSGSSITAYVPNDATGCLVLIMAAGVAPSWDAKVAQTSDITLQSGVTSYAWPA